MLTNQKKIKAFSKGFSSIYDLYPPENRIVKVHLRPLPDVSLEKCRIEISMYFNKSLQRYEQEKLSR
jgi:hypothetical protein